EALRVFLLGSRLELDLDVLRLVAALVRDHRHGGQEAALVRDDLVEAGGQLREAETPGLVGEDLAQAPLDGLIGVDRGFGARLRRSDDAARDSGGYGGCGGRRDREQNARGQRQKRRPPTGAGR